MFILSIIRILNQNIKLLIDLIDIFCKHNARKGDTEEEPAKRIWLELPVIGLVKYLENISIR